MTDRDLCRKNLDKTVEYARQPRLRQLLNRPWQTVSRSVVMRTLNQFLGGQVHLERQASTFFGPEMTVVVPSSAEDLWLFGAPVASDAEIRLTRHWLSTLKPEDTVFDVGANLGYYALLAAAFSDEVFAFEPSPRILPTLRRNLRGTANATVVETALGDREGTAPLFLAPTHLIGSSSFVEGWTDTTETAEVETTTLDRFCRERGLRPDWIKIDVEGFEESVLKGAREILTHENPTVAIEVWFHPKKEEHRRAMQLLLSLGYAPLAIEPSGESRPLQAVSLENYFDALRLRYAEIGDHGPDMLLFKKP
ncbi:MAG: hypothetical protein CO113_03215 [Elusimicrobia bacterium CG_4_9_14_3_um_filter_62_55]|nr:MAG: hypothetical protein COR54_01405 [Elusimicrobia bacterium CG22_combo_CG10-13_8_21_14_all_63_91]PJA14013.1 MAG: hypothetical protein COX66_13690 [Elusimicrobia bacterium CG_4_10_14_0_2_um_filter_63_34]PJB26540.1 MAG: hypothetical protein CO113_03215 [Elusimicrobia bacterium CG_4_9_14_3_um_filter_62_55]